MSEAIPTRIIPGPFDKDMMQNDDGTWSWKTWRGEWLGNFQTQRECEENICIHCGD